MINIPTKAVNAGSARSRSPFVPCWIDNPSRYHCVLVLSVVIALLSGCATSANGLGGTEAGYTGPALLDNDESIVATDLVSVLMQLPGLDPWSTTVQFSPATSDFGGTLEQALISGGYGLQRVYADHGRRYVNYARTRVNADSGFYTTFSLTIAGVTIERDFRKVEELWFPKSVVVVRGAKPTQVRLNDDLYRQRGGTAVFPSGVLFEQPGGERVAYAFRSVQVTEGNARTLEDQVSKERFLIQAKSNLYLAARLTDSLDISKFEPTRQGILRFPEADPRILGDSNKQVIKSLTAGFSAQDNAFTITGCSHGKSLIWDGTESAALDRQQRVKEELLILGIHPNRIREKGCFDSEFSDLLPKNGVVLTLRRALSAET